MLQQVLIDIKSCKNFVKLLDKTINTEEKVKQWFQQLCAMLAKILYKIASFVKYEKRKIEKHIKDTILLYLTQLTSSLGLLIQIFVKENSTNVLVIEARNCVKRQLCWCLDGLEDVLVNNKTHLDTSGSFIKWMDASLDQLEAISFDKPISECRIASGKARELTEEVLCHAMSVAQVALSEDCKIIKGASHAVLQAFDDLNNELSKPLFSISMCNLFVDYCNEKLCALERKVNEAVLKLCLKLFGSLTEPLENLYKFCINNHADGFADAEDKLDTLIADFDTHVDQIMQVGLFAVACNTENKYCIKMRSCLASLEALEVELVPAFSSLLKEKSLQNSNLAFLLKNYWIHQATMLKQLIYPIVDPYAFTRVTYDECESSLNEMVENMKKNNYIIDSSQLQNICGKSAILREMLVLAIEQTPPPNAGLAGKLLNDFTDVLYEVKSADKILKTGTNLNLRESSLRIVKRCKILLGINKKIAVALLDDGSGSETNQNEADVTESENVLLNIVEKDLPDKLTISADNPALDHLISRGKQILKDRSVLYKTPSKNANKTGNDGAIMPLAVVNIPKRNNNDKPLPLSKLVHLRKLNFFNSFTSHMDASETPLDLQVTDILEELTALGNTIKE